MTLLAITLASALLGAAVLLLLVDTLRKAQARTRPGRYRSGAPSLADLLDYAAIVENGIAIGKSGAFTAAWAYRGEDHARSSDEERERVSSVINRALAGLGSGWSLHVDAVRRAAPGYPDAARSHFPDPISAAMDEERRQLFEQLGTLYSGGFVLTLTWLPPKLLERRFADLMFDDDAAAPTRRERTLGLIHDFKRQIAEVEDRLSNALELIRLRGYPATTEDGRPITHDALLAWFQRCITGEDSPVALPNCPVYLDTLLGGCEVWSGVVPKIGTRYLQVVAITGFPSESSPGMLTALAELPCEYRWSTRFVFMDRHEAVKQLESYRRKWRQKIRGFFDQVFNLGTGPVDHNAVSMVQDAEAALAELNAGEVGRGYYTSVVLVLDEERALVERAARQVQKAIDRLGFKARIETINTFDAYLGSLPGHAAPNLRRPLLDSLNLADLIPTSSIWTGHETAPCPKYPSGSPPLMQCVTRGATPFWLNLHALDLGHALLFGFPGSGKSTHLAFLAASLRRYPGMTIAVFDKGFSLYAITRALGGQHFAVGADGSKLCFAPLRFLDQPADRTWAAEWIEVLLTLNGLEVSPEHRNAISTAIESLHASGSHTLSDFISTVQNADIRETLRAYSVDGLLGHLLDAEDDGLHLSDFNTFELGELMGLGERIALPVLLYLFRRIERSLRGQPAAILIDEAWLMLGHPAFRARIRAWLKTLRNSNCVVVLSTQDLSDAVNSGIFDVLLQDTATKIFLPNVHARGEDAAALYKRMGLNSRELDILATATPKRQYYCVSEEGRRLYDLALGPLALAFVGASDPQSVAAIQALEARVGSDWPEHWLRARGIELSRYTRRSAA